MKPPLTWALWMIPVRRDSRRHAGVMPVLASPLPAALSPAVFTRAEALAAGASPQRLRATDVQRIARGLYARRGTPIQESDIVAALNRSAPDIVACGMTAARHWGFPLPWRSATWDDARGRHAIHLTTREARRRDTDLVTWHRLRLAPSEVAHVDSVRLTSRMRTWLDLGTELSQSELTMIGDHLVRLPRRQFEGRADPHCLLPTLQHAAQENRGRGAKLLRTAAADIRIGSDSPAETAIRLAVLKAGLPEPQLNISISKPGWWLGEPDLSWPDWKVCVEHEGPTHLTREQQEKDISRTEDRDDAGWIEVRTVAKDLRHSCVRAVDRITRALRRHGWPG